MRNDVVLLVGLCCLVSARNDQNNALYAITTDEFGNHGMATLPITSWNGLEKHLSLGRDATSVAVDSNWVYTNNRNNFKSSIQVWDSYSWKLQTEYRSSVGLDFSRLFSIHSNLYAQTSASVFKWNGTGFDLVYTAEFQGIGMVTQVNDDNYDLMAWVHRGMATNIALLNPYTTKVELYQLPSVCTSCAGFRMSKQGMVLLSCKTMDNKDVIAVGTDVRTFSWSFDIVQHSHGPLSSLDSRAGVIYGQPANSPGLYAWNVATNSEWLVSNETLSSFVINI